MYFFEEIKAALSAMKCKIINSIKTGYISRVTDDSSTYPAIQVKYKGKTGNATRISPYGLDSNPPNGSFVLIQNAWGQESNKFAVCADFIHRYKNLEEGEVAVYNTLTQSYVILKANGNIDVQANGDININANGNVNITASGNVNIQGINWLNHGHIGVQTGGDISGKVVQL